MSESLAMLSEMSDRLFAALAEKRGEGFAALWPQIEEAAFPGLLLSEAKGGFGGDFQDAFAVMRLAGYHALPLPLAEAVLATRLATDGGLALPAGLITLAARAEGRLDGKSFSGMLKGVPFARDAAAILAILEGKAVLLARGDAKQIEPGSNPAGEPRDTLVFENAAASAGALSADAFAWGAFARTAQIAGALDAALLMSITYANERQQFGKPIGKFQAVQQNLALFAEEAAAVNSAGQAAARVADHGDATLEMAAAKLRANMGASLGASIAHQVHGAIGFTQEHALHHLTCRLVAWRSEFGAEQYWATRLGETVAKLGPEGLWAELARRSDAA